MSRRRTDFGRQWRWPIAVAVATLIGLLSALLGQGGVWWALFWLLLAIPLLVIARHGPLRRLLQRKPQS